MDTLGYTVDPSLLAANVKVSDLIAYEGPILSHFTNNFGEDYLYYWVDHEENVSRWLIFKVDILYIKAYLQGELPLRELIKTGNNQLAFIGDYTNLGDKGTFKSLRIIQSNLIQEEYLPEVDSYYSFEIPLHYKNLFSALELSQTQYIHSLKEKAFYIKFSEIEKTHSHILSLDNLSSLLNQIKKSYNSYIEESFKKNFLYLYTNLSDLNKGIERIRENLQLRVIDAKIASFGLGLSADTIMLSHDLKSEVRAWSTTAIQDYKNEVIELDYENVDNLNYILKNYSPEARRSIFKPILDIYSDKKLEVSVSERNLVTTHRKKRPNKQLIKQIVDLPTIDQPNVPKEEKEFVTIAIEVEKGKELDKIPKKLVSAPLFEKRSDSIEITKTSLEIPSARIFFKTPLVLSVLVKSGVHIVENKDTGIIAEHEDLNEAIRILASEIHRAWTISQTNSEDQIKSLIETRMIAEGAMKSVNMIERIEPSS